jgi:raffinose/stachyose/melibiose transport system permease protein
MKRMSYATYGLLAILSMIALYPVAAMLIVALNKNRTGTSVSFSEGFTFENFRRAWDVGSFGSSLVSSTIVATSTMLLVTAVSILAGFAFGVLRFRGQSLLFYLVILGIIFPVESFVLPLYYQLQSFDLLNSYGGLILAETSFGVAFGAYWMRATFRAVPRSVIDAASIDGAGPWMTLSRILLRPARPAILALMVLYFTWTWNSFLLPLVVLSDGSIQTAPLGMAFFAGRYLTDYPGLAAASLIVSAPVIVVFVVLQRQFFYGLFSGTAKL